MTYRPTPEQFRAEDAKRGLVGCGHYDTGTVIKLSTIRDTWCASTDASMHIGGTADEAIRLLADMTASSMAYCADPASVARYAAVIAAAEQLTGHIPRPHFAANKKVKP